GPMIGRPKSATFRTLDGVGLDTFIQVAKNVRDHVEGVEKEVFAVPEFMNTVHDKGWVGAKGGQGRYLKQKGKDGSVSYELNRETFAYEERNKLKTAATEMAKQEKGSRRRLKALVKEKGDRASDLVWSVLKTVLLYSAELVGEISDDI